jgi:hypothetical protein
VTPQQHGREHRLAAVRDAFSERRNAGPDGGDPVRRLGDRPHPAPSSTEPEWFRGRVADLRSARGEPEPPEGHGRHAVHEPHVEGAADEPAEDRQIRPFLLTGGRTWTHEQALRIESLIRSAPGAVPGDLRFEARLIVDLSKRPTSIAELAVAMRLPIGVIRVLVGDLLDSGAVTVVQVEEISLGLLERIRDRVRAL